MTIYTGYIGSAEKNLEKDRKERAQSFQHLLCFSYFSQFAIRLDAVCSPVFSVHFTENKQEKRGIGEKVP